MLLKLEVGTGTVGKHQYREFPQERERQKRWKDVKTVDEAYGNGKKPCEVEDIMLVDYKVNKYLAYPV